MIKRMLCTMLCAAAMFGVSAQNVEREMDLSVNTGMSVEKDYEDCTISVKADDFGSGTQLSIEIRNKRDEYMILFDRAYTVKELKKMKPSIRFDKVYGGNSQNLLTCSALEGETRLILPKGIGSMTFKNLSGERMQCVLHIYIARYKEKGFLRKAKYLICEREEKKVTVNINKTGNTEDTDYARIKAECESLIEEVSGKTFCDRSKHKPSFTEQTQTYKDKIDKLKDEISDIKSANGWRETSKDYKKYKELKEQLEGIAFKPEYCGKCDKPKPVGGMHKCQYCNWTAKQAYDEMDMVWTTIKTSNNPKATKKNLIGNVRALHKAYNGGCPNLTKTMNAKPQAKKNTEEYYEDISK